MPLNGQASGGWTESSSALRLLYVGIRNSIGLLTDDAFTQVNPTAVADYVSTRVDTTLTGVLSGSVAFVRPDAGSNFIGGPGSNAVQTAIAAAPTQQVGYYPVGVFINDANGNAYENTPGVASGKGPYMSGQGTYGNALYETTLIDDSADAGNAPAGTAITYYTGMPLAASRNGFLTPVNVIGTDGNSDSCTSVTGIMAECFVRGANQFTTLGILKMPPDATQTELVYDQRV